MIAAFDLDGTLLTHNSSFAFCRFLCKRGFLARTDLLFCTATYLRHCYLGLSLWDLHRLVFERLFKGKTVASLSPFVAPFLEEKLEKLWYPPALARLRELQQRGVECLILSNSPRFLVTAIAQKLGVDKIFATEYQSNGRGELTAISLLMDGIQKGRELTLLRAQTCAYSDSHLDLPFLETAHTAVAVNPKWRLKKIAKERGWEIL